MPVRIGQPAAPLPRLRSEEHTSELQSQSNLVCRLLLEKKKHTTVRAPELCVPSCPRPDIRCSSWTKVLRAMRTQRSCYFFQTAASLMSPGPDASRMELE